MKNQISHNYYYYVVVVNFFRIINIYIVSELNISNQLIFVVREKKQCNLIMKQELMD